MVAGVSDAGGTSNTPVLGSTIGDKFDETVTRIGDREAVVSIKVPRYIRFTDEFP